MQDAQKSPASFRVMNNRFVYILQRACPLFVQNGQVVDENMPVKSAEAQSDSGSRTGRPVAAER